MNFTLEYNQSQGAMHHNHGKAQEGTYGWVTIAKSVTNHKAMLFEAFFNYDRNKKYPVVYIRAKWKAFEAFIEKQKEYECLKD